MADHCRWSIEPLETRTYLAAQLVADINTDTLSSNPLSFASLGSRAVFFAEQTDGQYGLWVTDGTTGGTALVRPNFPTWRSFTPDQFRPAVTGGKAYFQTATSATQYQIWVTDGTAAGTQILADGVKAGFPTSAYRFGEFVTFAGRVFFNATTSARGTELWSTDGTPEGTSLFMDIVPGATSGDVCRLTVAGDYLYFETREGNQVGLWRTDGTVAGTLPLGHFGGGTPNVAAALGGKLVFVGAGAGEYADQLWESDGTVAGTREVVDLSSDDLVMPDELTVMGGALYFAGPTGKAGSTARTLWRSDGTAGGTAPVVTDAATAGFSARKLAAGAGVLYFYGFDATTGSELWRSDGTAAGTFRVADVRPGSTGGADADGSPTVTAAGAFFTASDGVSGSELWFSDGTGAPGGTYLLKDFYPGTYRGVDATPRAALDDGRVVFRAFDPAVGAEPFVSDGTTVGTTNLRDIETRTDDSGPVSILDVGGTPVVGALPPSAERDPGLNENQRPLNAIDVAGGTATHLTSTIVPFDSTGLPYTGRGRFYYAAYQGAAFYFANNDPAHLGVRRLYRTDGTVAGTGRFGEFYANSGELAVLGDYLYFTGSSNSSLSTGTGVYRSDGTVAGTVRVDTLTSGTAVHLAVSGDTLYYAVGGDLYKIRNQDAAATRLGYTGGGVQSINPTPGGPVFFATNVTPSRLLGVTDPSGANLPGTPLSSVGQGTNEVVIFKDRAYYRNGATQLCVSDGTAAGTRAMMVNGKTLAAFNLRVVGDYLYFVADDGVHGKEWWRSDGTDAGTAIWFDMVPGSAGSAPTLPSTLYPDSDRTIARWRGSIYFSAQTPDVGAELWRVNEDGSGAPELVSDLYAGTTGSDPTLLTVVGGELYFIATRPDVGREFFGVVDDVAPRLTNPTFTPGGALGGSIRLRLSEAVSFKAGGAAPTLALRGGTAPAALAVTTAYDAATGTLTVTPTSPLANGDYRLTIPGEWVADAAGNPLGADYTFDFFVLPGDANRDRAVDFDDLVKVAQNYNSTGGKTNADGDFTGDGSVDFNDLVILAQHYNTTLPAAGMVVASASLASSFAADWGAASVSDPVPTKVDGRKKTKCLFSVTPVQKVVAPKPKPAQRRR
jgi:ELWxxDGT repeat protein